MFYFDANEILYCLNNLSKMICNRTTDSVHYSNQNSCRFLSSRNNGANSEPLFSITCSTDLPLRSKGLECIVKSA